MADQRRLNRKRGSARAFTLLEALVALVIFAVISVALSLSLTTAFQAQAKAQQREDEAGAVRAVFGYLTRDLQSAFISKNNPAFIFQGGQAGSAANSATSGGLLTLTTLAHRIETDETTMAASSGGGASNNANAAIQPQADFMLVRYDLEPNTGSLLRTVSAVPNLEMVGQPISTPQAVLADRIANLTLRFWDTQQKGWRNEWNYQPPEPTTQAAGQAGSGQTNTGQTTSGAAQPNTNSSTSTGDTTLPAAVEVTLVLARKDNAPITYTTMIPVVAPYESTTTTQQPATNPTGNTGNTGNSPNTGR